MLGEDLVIETGYNSYFDFLNHVIDVSSSDYACVVHDDVYLCSNFREQLRSLVGILNDEWPNWGVVGNAGVIPARVGYGALDVIRYVADPHGGPNFIGHILPAISIDGNVMLLNLKALRAQSVRMPSFDGYQFYDIILSIEAIVAGLGVMIAPQLACWHGSVGDQSAFDRAKQSGVITSYLTKRIKNRALQTLNGFVSVPLRGWINDELHRIDVEMDSLRTACRNRPVKKVAIVTRTQFRRPGLLDRCLRTIEAFSASAGTMTEFRSYVVTDQEHSEVESLRCSTLLRALIDNSCDTRYKLVEFAIQNIEADYFWFIDDDDWLFPNEAERLSLIVSLAPRNSILFIDCEQFDEKPILNSSLDDVEHYRSSVKMVFPAREYIFGLSGNNHTPFCGAIFARNALLSIPEHVYDTITRYEDFMAILLTLLGTNALPIVVDKLYCGISIRERGNSVTERDRSEWDRSMSEMVSHVVNMNGACQLLSLPWQGIRSGLVGTREAVDYKAVLEDITRSKSWRVTRPLRGIMRLIRGEIGLREFISRSIKRL
jgi:hypothetical protein